MEDWRLLREYAERGSEAAFTTLVDRHMDLVFSTALRRLNNPEAAQEVTQSVFCMLAQKARQLRSDTAFVSWLYRTTCFKAARYRRAECRRRRREEEAARMQSEPANENIWQDVLPHLDEAMAQLAEADRLAILLRFFQRKALKDVGAALAISEDAARMRIARSLGKLHGSLIRKGVTISAAALATEMSHRSVQAIPSDQARLMREAALQAAKVAGTPPLLAIFLIIMTNAKLKMAAGLGVILLAAGVGMFLWSHSLETPTVTENVASSVPDAPVRKGEDQNKRPSLAVRRLNSLDAITETQDLIASLQKALRQEAIVSEGNVFSYPVAPAVKAFAPNMAAALPTLLAGIKDTNELVRMNAALGIGYMQEAAQEAIPELLELAKATNESAEVRLTALNGLSYIAHDSPASLERNLSELIDLLNDPNFGLMHRAMGVIGAMGSHAREAVPALTALLNYSVPREEASTQLSIEEVTKADESKLDREAASLTRNIRISAAEALQQIGPGATVALPILERLLQETDKQVRASAGIALWKIAGRTDGAAAVAESLSPSGLGSMYKGLNALGEMGPAAAAAISAVDHLAHFINPEIREPALAALSKMSPPREGR